MNEPTMLPAAAAIILNRDAEVLLLREFETLWRLPFTAIQARETPIAAVHRLASEQCQLSFEDLQCIAYSSASDAVQAVPHNDKHYHPHCFLFSSTLWQGEPQAANSATELRFFSLRELPALEKPMAHYLEIFVQWLPERGFNFV